MAIHRDRIGINKDFRIPPRLLPSVWSERHISIARGNARPGKISYSDLVYQREIMDTADNRKTTFLSVMSAAQCGKTQILLNLTSFYVAYKPRSIIILTPTETDSRVFLAGKLNPLMRANKDIARLFVTPRSNKGVFNNQVRDFFGGQMFLCWSQGLATLRGRSAPFTACDEVDEMPVSSQGHPADIIAARSSTFGDARLVCEFSTPTDEGISRIDSRFQLGDKRRWFMQCINCQDYREPKWDDVEWSEENPFDTARWLCRECGYSHQDYERIEASRQGLWIADDPFLNHASFHISGLASPLRRLGDMTTEYQALVNTGKPQNTFVNTVLGEVFMADSQSAEHLDLQSRAEDYDAEVPSGVRGLVGACDVQHDRLEAAIYGFDSQQRNWIIAYHVIYGNPNGKRVWDELGKLIIREYKRKDDTGQHCLCFGIDAKFETMHVERFISGFRNKASRVGCRLYAIRGTNSQRNPSVVMRPTSRYRVGRLSTSEMVNINAHASKHHALKLLNVDNKDAAGYCHFNLYLDNAFYDSLTSEELRTTLDKRGYPKLEYVKLRERNEAFDIFRYNHAMAMLSGVFREGDDLLGLSGRSGKRASRHFE